jgi:hypothetical protein
VKHRPSRSPRRYTSRPWSKCLYQTGPGGRTPPSSDEASMVSPVAFWYARKSGLTGATETAMLFCPSIAAAGAASVMPTMRATTMAICFRVITYIRNLRRRCRTTLSDALEVRQRQGAILAKREPQPRRRPDRSTRTLRGSRSGSNEPKRLKDFLSSAGRAPKPFRFLTFPSKQRSLPRGGSRRETGLETATFFAPHPSPFLRHQE